MIVGLTGGIGSGKSMVAKLFELLGCAVFNSDEVAKELYYETAIKEKVVHLLGQESYVNSNEINKTYISFKIFNDTGLLHQLNQIIHPAVIEKFKLYCEKNQDNIVIKETALLFEANLTQDVDYIVVVAANDELRIQRIMQRDALTKEVVLKKISAQLLQELKIKKADFVIYNNEEEFLISQVLNVFKILKSSN